MTMTFNFTKEQLRIDNIRADVKAEIDDLAAYLNDEEREDPSDFTLEFPV